MKIEDVPWLVIFASGTATGGGSGFEKLVIASKNGKLNAYIFAVVSNHANGGVREKADRHKIPFIHMNGPWDAVAYQKIAKDTGGTFFALSGWLKKVKGLDSNTNFNSKTVFNIHPGPLPKFGGPGMYGHHVHEAVIAAFKQGKITHTEVCMHFLSPDEEYDRGPVFFRNKIEIQYDDTPETLARRVNDIEHQYQTKITDLVVNGEISWDGINPDSLKLPPGYSINW